VWWFVQVEEKIAVAAGKLSWKTKPVKHKIGWGKTLPAQVSRYCVRTCISLRCSLLYSSFQLNSQNTIMIVGQLKAAEGLDQN
jgi:hypothetical protein